MLSEYHQQLKQQLRCKAGFKVVNVNSAQLKQKEITPERAKTLHATANMIMLFENSLVNYQEMIMAQSNVLKSGRD